MPAPTVSQTPVSLNYVYCDSPAKYAHALCSLRTEKYLILDCEGYNLGRAGGCVTLICVGSPFAEHIFLFDLLSPIITHHDVYSLLHLLCDPSILKIVWDGRMDYLEIFTTFGAVLDGVLDLQVAEVASRMSIRGEGDRDRLARLPRSYIPYQFLQKSDHCRDMHAVIGLQRCWTDCGYAKEVGKDRESPHMSSHFARLTHFRVLKLKSCRCTRTRNATCGSEGRLPSSSYSTPRRTFCSSASCTPTSSAAAGYRQTQYNITASSVSASAISPPIESKANLSRQTSFARAALCLWTR